MKILVISNNYPLPEDHGNRMRTMNFVRFFKQYGTIDLVHCDNEQEMAMKDNPFRKEYCLELKSNVASLKDRIFRLWRGIPWSIQEYSSESEHELLSLIEAEDYDIIFVRYIYNTVTLFRLIEKYKRRVVIDFDDILSDSLYKIFGGFYSKFRRQLDRKILKSYERKCLRFGAAIFCSEDDRNKMARNNLKSNTHVVPNIYQNESFCDYYFGDGFNQMNNILFIGTLDYGPNLRGLTWFIETILPYLREKYNNIALYIVGKSPKERLLDMSKKYGYIKIYPDVQDIKPYYKECGLVIVPLLDGGGTRIKILEAGLANRPVLSTSLGAYGLGLRDEKELLLFADRNTFLSRYAMLRDQTLYRFLVTNLREVVVSNYSIFNFNSAMEKVVLSLSEFTKLK